MAYRNALDTTGQRRKPRKRKRATTRKRKRASGSTSRSRSRTRRRSASTRSPRKKKRRSSSASSRRRSTTTKKRKVTLYTRYDPVTGQRARVPASDERKDDWLTPTQWRAEQKRRDKEREEAIKAGVSVVAAAPELVTAIPTVARAAGERVRAGVSAARAARLSVGVGGAAVGIGTAAAVAILAGAASYFGTRWLIEKFGTRLSKSDRAYRAAQAYREARRDAEKKLGRDLTPDEHAYLAREFKAKLRSIGWGS